MSRRRSAVLAIALLLPLPYLSGCAGQHLDRAALSRQSDCRAQADRRYEAQNRSLLSEADQTGTPFSSSGVPGDTSAGLSDLYRRDRDACSRRRRGAPVPGDPAS